LPKAAYVPLAVEYTFGLERFPEINVHFGAPVQSSQLGQDSHSAQQALEQALQSAQDALLETVCKKDPSRFELLLQGRGGASLPYDLWRTLVARWHGRKPQLNHSVIS
jgi:hypothetical protein